MAFDLKKRIQDVLQTYCLSKSSSIQRKKLEQIV